MNTVGDRITNQKIDNCRNRPVGENFYKCVDLTFAADSSNLEKSKTGVHGENHDSPQEQKQHIPAMAQSIHRSFHYQDLLVIDY